MRRVCHITSVHLPEDNRIFLKECTSLAKAGYEVYLVEQGESYEKNGVHIVGVGQASGGRLSRMTTFAKKVYAAAVSVDAEIYHIHDPELLPWGMKLKRQGKKVVFDSHENYSEMLKSKPYLPEWCTRTIAAFYTIYERYVLRRIDGVICPCTEKGKNRFEGICPRSAMVNNMPRLEELYDNYEASAAKTPRSVVYVGAINHGRGVTHLVKAAARSESIVYLGGSFETEEYRAELESMPEFACVRYLGRLNRQQVLETLQSSCIGLSALLNVGQYNQGDNLPTKAYEYMSLGLPVILTRAEYDEKVMQQYEFGLCVDPEDVEEFAAAIRYLLDHPEEAKRMGENGRRAVREEFNWGVEEKKLFALYEDILKE